MYSGIVGRANEVWSCFGLQPPSFGQPLQSEISFSAAFDDSHVPAVSHLFRFLWNIFIVSALLHILAFTGIDVSDPVQAFMLTMLGSKIH